MNEHTRIYSPDWSFIASLSSSPSPCPRPYTNRTPPPPPPPLPPPPLRRQRPFTTRDDRIRVRTLREMGHTHTAIACHLGLTRNQVQYASQRPSTPQRRSGRPSTLSADATDQIIEWICASKANRRCRWDQIPRKLGLDIGYYAVRYTLRKAGFSCRLARRKPPISERNREARLAFALEHRDWTSEQWNSVLWTDETWQIGGRHTRTWVTRRRGEEWDPTCIIERFQRRVGWMFWGSFADKTKGPALFWEKEWGTITLASYRERIVPLLHEWIHQRRQRNWAEELTLMQDNAPGHRARATL
jgi:transposase